MIRIVIVGCGNRGLGYSMYAIDFPDKAKVVAIAEPNKVRRDKMAKIHKLSSEFLFTSWEKLVELPRMADAALITTQDKMHCEPTKAFAKAGYHILLEKPMATSVEECYSIYETVNEARVIFGVGHVLRYSNLYRTIKSFIDDGLIGDVVSINHMENIGYWHFAHSFVRGNWRNEAESTFSLLAKSCHDIDLILYFMKGAKVTDVSSFGSLYHFSKTKKPVAAGVSTNCFECPYERECIYSCKKIYLKPLERGNNGWPVNVVSDNVTLENVESDLRKGPYGRCVYECDNDVADNQVVSMQFEGGKTATFTMVAFSEDICIRKTRIFGTLGEIVCDGFNVQLFQFQNPKRKLVKPDSTGSKHVIGHFGSDFHLMDTFVQAVSLGRSELILSGPKETLHSHLLVFAAELARQSGRVVNFQEYLKQINLSEAIT